MKNKPHFFFSLQRGSTTFALSINIKATFLIQFQVISFFNTTQSIFAQLKNTKEKQKAGYE